VTAWWVLWGLVVVWLIAWQTRRALCEASEHVRIITAAERTHDVGPDALRLLQDLDAHLDTYATQLAGLYKPSISPDPVLAAGCDRLHTAIRDHREEGTP
jgi:hypothetical protein